MYSKTGNIYLDSIINFKLSEAEQLGTKLQYRVEAASDQVIDPRDLTIILGNLLDNAITAVTSVSNKTIHFYTVKQKEELSFLSLIVMMAQ